MKDTIGTAKSLVEEVSTYISQGRTAGLPAQVVEKAKYHILDTLAAIVSGSKLKPGESALRFAGEQEGIKEAQVACSGTLTSAINAAFAHGIMAHADETDDSHPSSLTHPGCSIVPAALAMSERAGADGITFIKGVVVGYDIGCRITQALGVKNLRQTMRSSHSIGGNFGAAAASACVAGLKSDLVRYVLSYAAEQTSGISAMRDQEHQEKAFVFAGMPARNGVTAAILVLSGFTGVQDPFNGPGNFFEVFSHQPAPELLVKELGNRYEIMFTNIKRFSVGSPIQAAIEALLLLIKKHGLTPKDIVSMTVRVADAAVVDNRKMPDVNIQYILAVTLLDGDLTFEQAHSFKRMNEPAVMDLRKRIKLVADAEMASAKIPRQGIVEIITSDGSLLKEHVVSVRGTVENPMTRDEVEKKCRELMMPVLGDARSQELINRIWHLEQVKDVRELRPLLSES